METRMLTSVLSGVLGAVLMAVLNPLTSQALAQDLPPPPDDGVQAVELDPNAEVMTRGPVHEAYAVPVTVGQTAGMIVPRQPAVPIEEVPPDMKPEGDDSIWIPGYWSWDDERKDFIWVSGVWRVPPPGYRWMPGYWQEVAGQGWQWVSGYWMPANMEEATFLPQPPESLEAGPTSVAPDNNHFWIAGNWQWQDTRYAWQPGYWAQCNPDWIWVPGTYYWCPRGWVYVPGYWDYPLARRGMVFSPVYFPRPVRYYRPAVCIDVGVLSFSLFCRPNYCHYYFGDYYDDRYVAMGIRPWHHYHSPRHGYDPLYGYYRWYHHEHLGEREWDRRLAGWHDYYRAHPDRRPPHTLAAQQALLANAEIRQRADFRQINVAHEINRLKDKPEAFVKLQPVSQTQRNEFHQVAKQTFQFEKERREFERNRHSGSPPGPAGSGDRAGHGPPRPEKASLADIPHFKSKQLPGATNINPLVGRPAGGDRAGGRHGGVSIGPDGKLPGGGTIADPGRGGLTNPNLRPGFARPGGFNPGGVTTPQGGKNPLGGNPGGNKPAGGNADVGKPAGGLPGGKPPMVDPRLGRPGGTGPGGSGPSGGSPGGGAPGGVPGGGRGHSGSGTPGKPPVIDPRLGRPGGGNPGGTTPGGGSPNVGPGSGRPAGGNPGGGNPGGGNPGGGNRGGHDHDRKPRASVETPSISPPKQTFVPSRTPPRATPSNPAGSAGAVQPRPTFTRPPTTTVAPTQPARAVAPPPMRMTAPPPARTVAPPPERAVAPPSRSQPPANNNPGGRGDGRGDEHRGRDKDKREGRR